MSRRKCLTIAVLCVSLILLLVYLDHRLAAKRSQLKPKTSEQLDNLDWQKYHGRKFEVINVVDGDTLDIDIPDGQYNRTRIRLWGVDTPETKNKKKGIMYFGPEAAEFTKEAVLGTDVVIYLDKNNTRGKYQRLLAYVKLPDGRILNELLVSDGFAYADLRFKHKFYNKYRQLEASARSGKKGLWQNVTRRQLPEWLQRKKPKLLKK